jgi:hypothetical protein
VGPTCQAAAAAQDALDVCNGVGLHPELVFSADAASGRDVTNDGLRHIMHQRQLDAPEEPGETAATTSVPHGSTTHTIELHLLNAWAWRCAPVVVILRALHQHGHEAHAVHVVGNALRPRHAALHPPRPLLSLQRGERGEHPCSLVKPWMFTCTMYKANTLNQP